MGVKSQADFQRTRKRNIVLIHIAARKGAVASPWRFGTTAQVDNRLRYTAAAANVAA
jgi:hypothetical protein